MKSAGKARNNGLYRHIRTSKEIIRNLLNDSSNSKQINYTYPRRFDAYDPPQGPCGGGVPYQKIRSPEASYFYYMIMLIRLNPTQQKNSLVHLLLDCDHF